MRNFRVLRGSSPAGRWALSTRRRRWMSAGALVLVSSIITAAAPLPARAATGNIFVVKETVPDGATQSFNFTSDIPGGASFDLQDNQPGRSFVGVPTGTYNLTENVPTGWTLSNIACPDPTGNTTTSGSTATIRLDAGETVHCKFTDTANLVLDVRKTADPTTLTEPGGVVNYFLEVVNQSPVPVVLTSLVDDRFGDLNGQGTCATGGTIPAFDSYSCTFQATLTNQVAGVPHTNTVTATGTDPGGRTVMDTGSATVTIVACEPVPGDPADASASGEAYAAKVVVPLLGINRTLNRTTSSQSGPGDPPASTIKGGTVNIPGVVSAKFLNSSSDAEVTQTQAKDVSTASVANINLLNGAVEAKTVEADAEATATGAGAAANSFGSTIQSLKIGGVPVANIRPGTVLAVPGVGNLFVYDRQVNVVEGDPNTAGIVVDMLRLEVTLGALNGTTIVISRAAANASFPATTFCGARPEGTVSGFAAVARVRTNPLLAALDFVTAGPIPESGGADSAQVALVGPIFSGTTKLVGAQAATAETSGTFDGVTAIAESHAEVASLEALKAGASPALLTGRFVAADSSSEADAGGADSVGSTTLVDVKINGTNVCTSLGLASTCTPAPNTEIVTGLVLIRLNEQVETTVGLSTEITVNAIHVFILAAGNPFGLPAGADVIISQVHSDASFLGVG